MRYEIITIHNLVDIFFTHTHTHTHTRARARARRVKSFIYIYIYKTYIFCFTIPSFKKKIMFYLRQSYSITVYHIHAISNKTNMLL